MSSHGNHQPGDGDYQLVAQHTDGVVSIAVRGRIEVENAQQLLNDIVAHLEGRPREVVLDLSGVNYFDSGGGAVLISLRQRLAREGGGLRIDGSTPAIDGFLSLVDQDALLKPPSPTRRPVGLVTQIGAATLEVLSDAREIVAFTGEVIVGLRDALLHPRRVRWRETWLYMERAGTDALPIVALISFLMGLITAFQAAVQLSQFGADIYVANLVGLSIVRELGPLMTAILLAGRSGAAFAAELGTMKVREEIDALTTMGLAPVRFLVVPRVVAGVAVTPLLTLYFTLAGLAGGAFVYGLLGFPFVTYVSQIAATCDPGDLVGGLVKAFCFGILVVAVGCLRGLQAGAGPGAVGQAATRAVVSGIVLIILADGVLSVLYYALGV